MATKKIDLPVLKDVVVLGKEVPDTNELPPILSEFQLNALQQQIEKIVKTQLEDVLNKATHEAITEIKAHLDDVLPELIKNNQIK